MKRDIFLFVRILFLRLSSNEQKKFFYQLPTTTRRLILYNIFVLTKDINPFVQNVFFLFILFKENEVTVRMFTLKDEIT